MYDDFAAWRKVFKCECGVIQESDAFGEFPGWPALQQTNVAKAAEPQEDAMQHFINNLQG